MNFSVNYAPLVFVKHICSAISVVPVVKHTGNNCCVPDKLYKAQISTSAAMFYISTFLSKINSRMHENMYLETKCYIKKCLLQRDKIGLTVIFEI
jgi:hypothetical protein